MNKPPKTIPKSHHDRERASKVNQNSSIPNVLANFETNLGNSVKVKSRLYTAALHPPNEIHVLHRGEDVLAVRPTGRSAGKIEQQRRRRSRGFGSRVRDARAPANDLTPIAAMVMRAYAPPKRIIVLFQSRSCFEHSFF